MSHTARQLAPWLTVMAVTAGVVVTLGMCWSLFVNGNSSSASAASPRAMNSAIAAPNQSGIMFRDVTQERGIEFTHTVARPDEFYFPDIMSSGGALYDLDHDGLLDIFLLNGSQASPHGPVATTATSTLPPVGNRLLRQGTDGRFTDITSGSGLESTAYASGVAIADVNNDGRADVYVTNIGDDQLYVNRGQGKFQNISLSSGIANPLWATSASFLDYDRDGWLDLFVANYVDYHSSRSCINRHGREDYCHPSQFEPTCHKLYHNVTGKFVALGNQQGAGSVRFEDVSLTSGIVSQRGPGLGVCCADFNNDGWQDIYVANDSTPNFLWINQRNGTFQDEAVARGVATDGQGQPQSSMGVVAGDMDGDGLSDLFMTHFRGEPHTLYKQMTSEGLFTDHTVMAGLYEATFHSTGFGVVAADFDQDGDLDLAVANGHVKQDVGTATELNGVRKPFGTDYQQQNEVFVNDGNGQFKKADADCGFRSPREVSRGLACGDVNGDGAIDLLVTNAGGPARLCLNAVPHRGNWLVVRLIEPLLGGRDAFGAVVTIKAGQKQWRRVINSGFSYLSASDPRAHFGLGSVQSIDQIDVQWADGSHERFSGGPVNRFLELAHDAGESK